MNNRLFLIDGSAVMYRAHFAFIRNPLRTSRGEITSAIFGFLNTLISIIEKEKPTHLAIVFDTAEPTFRHKAYPSYKATRQKMPEELVDQLGRLDQVLAATGIPIIAKPGWEADDVIGTLSKKAEAAGFDVFMVTADKDYQQLVTDKVFLWNPSKEDGLVMGPAEVRDHFGVLPGQVVDVLALMGDSSDNVPGVGGIGPKTALKLIEDYGSLEQVLDAAEEMKPGKVKEALIRDREQALLSKELVTIDCQTPVEFLPESYVARPILTPELERLLHDLELHRLLDRIRAKESPEGKAERVKPERDYRLITDAEEFRRLVAKWIAEKPLLSIDVETTSAEPMAAELVGASFSDAAGTGYYVSVREFASTSQSSKQRDHNLDLSTDHGSATEFSRFGISVAGGTAHFLGIAKPLYENKAVPKTGQNLKYDCLVLRTYGIEVRGTVFDTILAAYLINPGSRSLSIDALSRDYLNLPKIPTDELIGSGSKQITMAEVDPHTVAEYASEDADYALRLTHTLKPLLGSQEKLLYEVELPLSPVLLQMEMNGITLDSDLLAQMSKELDRDMARIQQECFTIAGEEFNLNSPKQLAAILFDKLKLPVQKKLKTGPSTDVDTLTALAPMHELPMKLLEFRTLSKLKGTYVDALPTMVHPKTGRVHTTFSQTIAATGRLASNNPNLQNIPIRTEVGRRIREAFVPGDPSWVLISADYSQIELRIMAHLSGDEKLIAAFQKGGDIHAETAALVFRCDLKDVTPDMRRAAKTVNFGIIYGQTDFGLSQELGIPRAEAKAFRDNYFRLYPGVSEFMKRTIESCRENGFVETILGRQRRIPDIHAKERQVREFAERTAINTPVQGSAADMIKLAMIGIHDRLKSEKFAGMMLLQVHDELVFEAPEHEAETLAAMVREQMQTAMPLNVPVVVDVGFGVNWLKAH